MISQTKEERKGGRKIRGETEMSRSWDYSIGGRDKRVNLCLRKFMYQLWGFGWIWGAGRRVFFFFFFSFWFAFSSFLEKQHMQELGVWTTSGLVGEVED